MGDRAPTQTTPTANPLSAATALGDAFTYVFPGFSNFFRLSWKFLLFVVVAAACFFGAIYLSIRAENDTGIIAASVCAMLFGMLVSVAYYIVIARNWLLNETDPQFLTVYGPFLLRVIGLSLLMVALMTAIFLPVLLAGIAGFEYFLGADETSPAVGLFIFAMIVLVLVALFAVLAGAYVAGRITPWMVAAAVPSPMSLRESWAATKGAGLRILGGMVGLIIIFMIIDLAVESALRPLLGVTSESFEKLAEGNVPLPALFALLLAKILVYFPQTALGMVYCASVYRQASGR